MQKADFLGIVQVFVYTGAVMMLFLFVLMLVGVDSSDSIVETIKGQRWASLLLVVGLAGMLFFSLGQVVLDQQSVQAGMDKLVSTNADTGNVTGLAELIFGQYVWIFEVTSALLITAALGAMVLAHRERLDAAHHPGRVGRQARPRQQERRGPARARCLRPPQRGRHPGAAARRHAERPVRLARPRGP